MKAEGKVGIDQSPSSSQDRHFVLNGTPVKKYGHNTIRTAKYTPLTFLPLDLGIQFTKAANIYFVVLGIMQMIPIISQDSVPTVLLSLACVISVSVVKDLIENMKAWRRDSAENNTIVRSLTQGAFGQVQSSSLQVGSVVKVF